MKILLAIDGSKYSLKAVRELIKHAKRYRNKPEVELVYVHLPVPRVPGLGTVIAESQIRRYYREEGEAALAKARKELGSARIRYTPRILVGPVAETLARQAKARRCDLILIGTHGRTAAASMLLGSVASKVLHIAKVPVLLVK